MDALNAMKTLPITDHHRNIIEPEWLARSAVVHRQLRPHLPADYVARMQEVIAGGAEMVVVADAEQVLGISVFRMLDRTFNGREMYCDDLVADDTKRSTGVGHMLVAYMEALARERGCKVLTLDSGAQRQQAHKFYFREGFTITAFHFVKPLI